MWTCPACGRTFASRSQTHTCAGPTDLDRHFAGADPAVRATFERILAVVRAAGPVTVLPEKTRIALHVRMSFAALMPRRRWLTGHLVLARRVDSPRFTRVETYSPQRPARLPADHTRRGRRRVRGLVSAVFAVAVTQDQAPSAIALVALAPTLIFWGLDAYYLWNERLFRALYATRRAGPATARPASRTCRCST